MEDDLIQRAQAGDTAAFHALVERYTPVAWQLVRLLVLDSGQAEDALQEAWIDVWCGLPRFDLARPFRPWLMTVVANRCRMLARRSHPHTLALSDDLAGLLPDPVPMCEDHGALDYGDALHAALAALPPEQRGVVALRFQAELDLAEIAAVCQIPLSTAKSRLYRALATLRTRLLASSSASTPTETHS